MRIATWNVNSLKARPEARREVARARAAPDVLLMQETKLADDDAPVMALRGWPATSWSTTARALERRRDRGTRRADVTDVVTNFGDGPVRDSGPGAAVATSARTTSTRSTRRGWSPRSVDGIRIVSLYAPNGRVVGSRRSTTGKLRLVRAAARAGSRRERRGRRTAPLVLGGDLNVAPTDADVWDAARRPRRARTSRNRSGPRSGRSLRPGLTDAYRAQRDDEPGRFTVVGLPRGHVPQELRACGSTTCSCRRPWRHGSSTPRSTARRARAAGPVRPRAAVDRPRRSRDWPFDPDWAGALARIQVPDPPASAGASPDDRVRGRIQPVTPSGVRLLEEAFEGARRTSTSSPRSQPAELARVDVVGTVADASAAAAPSSAARRPWRAA